jgi:hypothetical protein
VCALTYSLRGCFCQGFQAAGGGDVQGLYGVECPTQHSRRPYGEGELEPDMEHQDEKEEPGKKGQEQEHQEEITESPRLRGRPFAANPDMQKDRRSHPKWSPCAGNLQHLGMIWSLPEIVRNLDRTECFRTTATYLDSRVRRGLTAETRRQPLRQSSLLPVKVEFEPPRTRTGDPQLKRLMLCQLS